MLPNMQKLGLRDITPYCQIYNVFFIGLYLQLVSLLTLPCLDFELMKLMLRIFYKFSVVYSCLWPLNICVHIVSVGKKIKYDGFNSSFLQRFYNIGFIWIEM